ncbi:DUF559 domain-containing protein [Catellatospora vulcania]|uniref:DUF559 domain-containing protein n=1 Tax=Catellatospora vulcania TaxID=1460450 RepID=UPI0012D4086C|nr:DUF559 domain-containing protein [Catellatospora vulcania]
MPRKPYRPPELVGRIFRRSDVLRHGLLTAHQVRSSAWTRLRYDVYADSRLPRDHDMACRAALMGLPSDAVVAGPSAAYRHGVQHAATFHDDVHVITHPKAAMLRRRGVRFHETVLDPDETIEVDGHLCTTPLRTAWDLAGWFDVVRAVTVIDSLLGSGLVQPDQLSELARERQGRRGSALARRAFELADGRAQSPPEFQLRVRVVLAGLPRPQAQLAVPVRGRVLHPDLAWPEYRVAVEYDGEWHHDPDQFHLDRRRLNLLVAEGWIVLHVTSRRLRADLPAVLTEIRQALHSRGWRP